MYVGRMNSIPHSYGSWAMTLLRDDRCQLLLDALSSQMCTQYGMVFQDKLLPTVVLSLKIVANCHPYFPLGRTFWQKS